MSDENVSDPIEQRDGPLSRAEVIVHPIRLRIIEAVGGQTVNTREIAARLPDVPQATLYRHVKKLCQANVLHVVESHVVNGIVERTYGLQKGATHLTREEFAAIPPEDHFRYFAIMLGTLTKRLERYLGQPEYDTTADGMTYFMSMLDLTQAEARKLRVDLLGLIKNIQQDLSNQTPRRRHTLGMAFIPDIPDSDEGLET